MLGRLCSIRVHLSPRLELGFNPRPLTLQYTVADIGLSKEDFWFTKSSVRRPKKWSQQAIVAILKTQEQIQPVATLLT